MEGAGAFRLLNTRIKQQAFRPGPYPSAVIPILAIALLVSEWNNGSAA